MKNVIIFQDFVQEKTYGHDWQTEELFKYFRAQIDNSLRLGWSPEDIVVATNLDFQYRGASILPLKDICQYNKYFNKQYGIAEILREELITEPFWFHDFDDWQLLPFTFPDFEGEVGMCKYIDFTQWNTGSIFVKPSSKFIWEFIVGFMKLNQGHPQLLQIGDENIVNLLYNQHPELHPYISELNTTYNVGATQFDLRYRAAQRPITIGAFKPGGKGYENFVNEKLVDPELEAIFKQHELI